jgi:hypothetical protein
MSARAALCSAVILLSLPAQAETAAQWIELGARVHGAFGAFIPIGIRIGLDAKEHIKAEPRGLTVTYYTGEKAPCPCIAAGNRCEPGSGNAGHRAGEGARWNPCHRHRAQSKDRRGLPLYRRRSLVAESHGVEQNARSRRTLRCCNEGGRAVRGGSGSIAINAKIQADTLPLGDLRPAHAIHVVA